jgi:hypothetical protein
LGCNRRHAVHGVFALTVAPEPFVERVVGAGQSTMGEIGTHMVLWALPRDSAVRLWGKSLHDLYWEARSGVHRVAPEAASEVKVQAETKFHIY